MLPRHFCAAPAASSLVARRARRSEQAACSARAPSAALARPHGSDTRYAVKIPSSVPRAWREKAPVSAPVRASASGQ
jgi:hypothetical protein